MNPGSSEFFVGKNKIFRCALVNSRQETLLSMSLIE